MVSEFKSPPRTPCRVLGLYNTKVTCLREIPFSVVIASAATTKICESEKMQYSIAKH